MPATLVGARATKILATAAFIFAPLARSRLYDYHMLLDFPLFLGTISRPMTAHEELLQLNQKLLDSISAADWSTYQTLCHPQLTCFEPETGGHFVVGLPFHKFYFDLGGASAAKVTTMASPHVQMLGPDAAIVCYTRLVQRVDASGNPTTARSMETRIWQRENGKWLHVHFHRSPVN